MTLAHLPRVPSTYSFSQRFSPAPIDDGGDTPQEAYLLLLMDEPQALCVSYELRAGRLAPEAAAEWLVRQLDAPNGPGARRGRPRELLVDDDKLAEALRLRLTGASVKVKVQVNLPAVDQALLAMVDTLEDMEAGVSLVEVCGPECALAFYRAAEQFYAEAPWTRLDAASVIAFQEGTAPRGLLVTGDEDEGGSLLLFHDLQGAQDIVDQLSVFPELSVSLAAAEEIAPQDRALINEHGLKFPRQGIARLTLFDLAQPLNLQGLQQLTWLLDATSQLARGEAVSQDGRSLTQVSPREVHELMVDQLTGWWKKSTRHARALAHYLLDHRAGRSTPMEMIVAIGRDYLSQVKSPRLDVTHFDQPALQARQRLGVPPEGAAAFDEIWNLLGGRNPAEAPPAAPHPLQFLALTAPLVAEIISRARQGQSAEGCLPEELRQLLRRQWDAQPDAVQLWGRVIAASSQNGEQAEAVAALDALRQLLDAPAAVDGAATTS